MVGHVPLKFGLEEKWRFWLDTICWRLVPLFYLKSNKLTMFSAQKNEKFAMNAAPTVPAYYIHYFSLFGSGTKLKLEPSRGEELERYSKTGKRLP